MCIRSTDLNDIDVSFKKGSSFVVNCNSLLKVCEDTGLGWQRGRASRWLVCHATMERAFVIRADLERKLLRQFAVNESLFVFLH